MSRFVSAGGGETSIDRNDAWIKAQQEVEASKKPKPEKGQQDDGKSLYETLQANKAAKQAEFEESIRLKNQFRTLDDDEVNFLDSVLESERAKEDAVRRDTAEQLEEFRRQREAAEKSILNPAKGEGKKLESDAPIAQTWSTKKRRRKELDNNAGKLRKTSTADRGQKQLSDSLVESEPSVSSTTTGPQNSETVMGSLESPKAPRQTLQPQNGPSVPDLGLGAYSSDED